MKRKILKNLFSFGVGIFSFLLLRDSGMLSTNVFLEQLKAGTLNIQQKVKSIDVNQILPANERGSYLVMRSGIPTWEKYFIDQDLTLFIPTDFNSIREAFDYLETKFILPSVIVTIQIEDGVYNFSSQVGIYHSDGQNIQIFGNKVNPAAVILNFSGSHGFFIDNGSKVKLIDGLTLVGDDTCSCHGIYVNNNSHAGIGSNMVIRDFQTGVTVRNNSYASVGGTLTSNTFAGIQVLYNSVAQLRSGTVTSYNHFGVSAANKSTINATSASSTNNSRGYSAYLFGTIHAGAASSNGDDFHPNREVEGNLESYIR